MVIFVVGSCSGAAWQIYVPNHLSVWRHLPSSKRAALLPVVMYWLRLVLGSMALVRSSLAGEGQTPASMWHRSAANK